MPCAWFAARTMASAGLLRGSPGRNPAFRSRLQNQITCAPLASADEAAAHADFYVSTMRADAQRQKGGMIWSVGRRLSTWVHRRALHAARRLGAPAVGGCGP
jgi:hypothetical protein